MPQSSDVELLAQACLRLPLSSAVLPEEYSYSSPCLALVDAIFSIGVQYQATQAVVTRLAAWMKIPAHTPHWPLPRRQQFGLSHLLGLYDQHTPEAMAQNVYENRQRTSSQYGILKAAAVGSIARILSDLGMEHFQDMASIDPDTLALAWITVPGQKSGISLQYFRMLSGSSKDVKPDRMVTRFVQSALARSVSPYEAGALLKEASAIVQKTHGDITPRLLDYVVWQHARTMTPSHALGV